MTKQRDIGIILVILLFVFLLSKNILFATTPSATYVNFRNTDFNNEIAYTNNCGSQLVPYKYDSPKQSTWSGHVCSSGMAQSSVFCGSNPNLLLNNLVGGEFRSGGAKPSLWKNAQQDTLCVCDDDGTNMAVRTYLKGVTSINTSPNSINPTLELQCIPTCIESWSCIQWTSCANNQQTRTCTDSNNCGTSINKPALLQSCDSTPICTQEAGQLCNPATKQLISYTDGCQKSDFLNQGYTADLSICNQNQQVCISNPQLLSHISNWVNNQITNSQLLSYITLWVNC